MDNSLSTAFQYLPDTAQCVSFKYNVYYDIVGQTKFTDEELENWWVEAYKRFNTASRYMAEKYGEILAVTCGFHEMGANNRPHFHFHFIVSRSYEIKGASSYSNEKTRWVKNHGLLNDEAHLKDMTISRSSFDPTKPKWQFLSYPLKERKRGPIMMYLYKPEDDVLTDMPVEMIDALESVGGALFDTALALQERKQKAEAKRENDLQELYEWAVKFRSEFRTFREMQEYFEDNFIFKKVQVDGVHALPDVVNYNKNLKKVGRALGIFRYCDDLSAK